MTTVQLQHLTSLKGTNTTHSERKSGAESDESSSPSTRSNKWSENAPETSVDIVNLFISQSNESKTSKYEHESLLPSWPDVKWEALETHEYVDKGLNADPTYRDLFATATKIEHLTPYFGSILHGVSLGDLNNKQRDQLARFTAFRGVVFFKNQEDFDVKKQLSLGRYWGKLHRHATTGLARGVTEDPDLFDVHVVYSDDKRKPNVAVSQEKLWHSDVSYEKQPPSYTTLKVLDGPVTGGDTLWTSGYGLYDLLSPALQKYLEGKYATHSAVEQAEGAKKGGTAVRREPIISVHPIVRVNPVTGWRSVYVNPGFTRQIVGVPDAESKAILNLLYTLLAEDVRTTVRFKWEKNDVALWDNRVTAHSASFGFYPNRRHAIRVTPHGEVPYFDAEKSSSQQETVEFHTGVAANHKDAVNPPVYND